MDAASPGPAADISWSALFSGPRGRLLIGLMLAEVATAMQLLVVISILPLITRDLGGISWYGLAVGATTLATLLTIPLAGDYSDRYGIRKVLLAAFGLLAVGVLIAGTAPSMPVLVVGRLVQGLGAGAQVVVSLTGVARVFPESLRPRVLMLTSLSWVLPSLIGPAYGTLLAGWVSWRLPILLYLAFLSVAAALVIPALAQLTVPAQRTGSASPRMSALLFGGSILAFGGLAHPSLLGVVLAVAGLCAIALSLSRLMPAGTARLRAGLPMTAVTALLVSVAFYSTQAILPVLLTTRLAISLRLAGLALTAGSLLWTAGTALQTWLAEHGWPPARSARLGASALFLGEVGVLGGALVHQPLLLYGLWGIGGVGMGLCYSAIWLNTMNLGRGAGHGISTTLLMFTLGMGFGGGIAGTAVSLGKSGHHLFPALSVILLTGALITACCALLASRFRDPGDSTSSSVIGEQTTRTGQGQQVGLDPE